MKSHKKQQTNNDFIHKHETGKPKVSRVIENANISNWQIEKLNEWNGKNMVSLISKPMSFRESDIVSDSKIAENAQMIDRCNWLLDKVGVPNKDANGNSISLHHRLNNHFMGTLDKTEPLEDKKNESTKKNNSNNKD